MKVGGNIFSWPRLNKSVSVFLLVFQSIFLNIIVPGHTRGVITLSGKSSVNSMADLGCPQCCCCECKTPQGTPDKIPSDKDRSECAICHFAAALSLPPVRIQSLPLLCRAERAEQPARTSPPSVRPLIVHHDRAPPVIV
jgi:hypothetical protein